MTDEQKEKIEEEVSQCPDVSVYLADPEDLDVIPLKCDPAVEAFHDSPVPIPFPVPASSLSNEPESLRKVARKKIMGGAKIDLSRYWKRIFYKVEE